MDTRFLRFVFCEIVNGYSQIVLDKSNSIIFAKHIDYSIISKANTVYNELYKKFQKTGLPTEKQRLLYLEKTDEWTPKDERSIKEDEDFLSILEEAKSKLALNQQIKEQKERISDARRRLLVKTNRRAKLIGATVESTIEREINKRYVFYSVFSDKELTKPFFEGDYDDGTEQFDEIEDKYSVITNSFSWNNIAQLAMSDFVRNLYNLCDGKIMDFYGKPAVSLSIYQEQLFKWIGIFKSIFESEFKPPARLLENPNELIDWFTGARNLSKMVDDNEGKGNVSIVGATTEDFEKIGISKKKIRAAKDTVK